ncbi:MAG TPA: OsmC family protein [Burkholderiales bacterium]|jgi:organic hydroperoxide reductase OsmC/OhrA
MSEHKATVKWSRGGKDFTYKTYSRDHVWSLNGNDIPASATTAYFGSPSRVDPEAALVAALSSCHMLTFLALAANKGFVVERYEDAAVGHLEKNAAGKLAMTRVELHPSITYGGAKQPTAEDLDWLHEKAHKECFIANSVTTEVRVVR